MDPTATDIVRSRAGELRVHRWEPASASPPLTVVTVHPWAPLGGSEYNCVGIASAMAAAGLRAVTFNMRSSSMVWGVLSNHGSEVGQVVDASDLRALAEVRRALPTLHDCHDVVALLAREARNFSAEVARSSGDGDAKRCGGVQKEENACQKHRSRRSAHCEVAMQKCAR